MKRFEISVTATVDAVHECDCECCKLAGQIKVEAAFDGCLFADDAEEAESLAFEELAHALDCATPDGYLLGDDEDAEVVFHVLRETSDVELVNYPLLPGMVVV